MSSGNDCSVCFSKSAELFAVLPCRELMCGDCVADPHYKLTSSAILKGKARCPSCRGTVQGFQKFVAPPPSVATKRSASSSSSKSDNPLLSRAMRPFPDDGNGNIYSTSDGHSIKIVEVRAVGGAHEGEYAVKVRGPIVALSGGKMEKTIYTLADLHTAKATAAAYVRCRVDDLNREAGGATDLRSSPAESKAVLSAASKKKSTAVSSSSSQIAPAASQRVRPVPSGDYSFSAKGHSIRIAPVQSTGGRHEGKYYVKIRGPQIERMGLSKEKTLYCSRDLNIAMRTAALFLGCSVSDLC